MQWLRFLRDGAPTFGTRDGEQVLVHRGSPFDGNAAPTDERVALDGLAWLPPCVPTKIVGLWNNFRAAAEKNGWAPPAEPLWFLKSPGSAVGHRASIAAPAAEVGRVAYEGELVVVIGRRAKAVSVADAPAHVLGYCCGNDVTAMELLNRDASFAQWSRAKSFDGFAAFGPWIETEADVANAMVRTVVGGRERQSFSLADMFFTPAEIVSRLSHDMTLEPGDVIFCGTSLGVLPMKPGSTVAVSIDGLGTLENTYG